MLNFKYLIKIDPYNEFLKNIKSLAWANIIFTNKTFLKQNINI